MSQPIHTRTLAERLLDLPHDLNLMIWEIILNGPRVVNLEFLCDDDRRCTWLFSRDDIEKLTYPARLSDPRCRLKFTTIGSFNRTIRVIVDRERSIEFSLSLERDIFFLRSFHSSNVISTLRPVDTENSSLTELKHLRRIMVSSDEIIEVLSSHGNAEWSWYEERFFGPIGHADSQIEEYIVLLDHSQQNSHIWADYLMILSEYEMLTAISSTSIAQTGSAVTAGPNLYTDVQTISAAWKAWSKEGSMRLPELSFARIRHWS